jgi:hypothetical protein
VGGVRVGCVVADAEREGVEHFQFGGSLLAAECAAAGSLASGQSTSDSVETDDERCRKVSNIPMLSTTSVASMNSDTVPTQ